MSNERRPATRRRGWTPAALGALALLAGCNLLTGSDGITIVEDDDDDGTSTFTGGGTPGGTAGFGGTNPAGGTGGVGASGAFGGTSAQGGAGGSGAGPTSCTYPAGPYGVNQGDTLPPTLQWQGYRDGSSTVETIDVEDYFDCDGSRGIHGVFFSTSQWTCGGCQQESSELESRMNQWQPMGIKVAVLLLTGPSGPPDTQAALQWKTDFGLQRVAVVADPSFSLVVGGSVGTPQRTIVNPRTMQVHYLQQGYSSSYPQLESLAQQNASQ